MQLIKIYNKQDIIPYLSLLKQAKILAIDMETTGLDPHLDKIRLIQIATFDLPVLIIDCFSFLPDGVEVIKGVIEAHSVKIFQNAKFDLQFLMAIGIHPEPIFDTMIAGQLLQTSGGCSRTNLNAMAQHYVNETIEKVEQKSDWSGELSEEQFAYAAKDAYILLALREVMVKIIYENNLSEIAMIEFLCVSAIAQIEFTGICLDTLKWNSLLVETEKKKDEILSVLHTFTKKPAVQMSLFGDDVIIEYNFDNSSNVLKLLKSNGIHVTSITKHNLIPYANHPLVCALLDYRKISKKLASYLYPIPSTIHSKTGRLHPRYWQIASASGRMSCANPNIQQIPRSISFRECFVATAGYKLVIADYSQIELRVVADMTGDERMIAAYRKGTDLHRLSASLLLGKQVNAITNQERQAAKAVNFGLIYAMGATGLKQYAFQSYGIEMSIEQAEKFRNRFFKTYTGIADWHNRLKKSPPIESRTLSGRKITYSDKTGLSSLCIMPIQGTAADIVKKALGLLARRLKGTGIRIIGIIHDEILLEALESDASYAAKILKSTMEEAGNSILKHVPCLADVSIAANWSK